jgi:hypothetical protein
VLGAREWPIFVAVPSFFFFFFSAGGHSFTRYASTVSFERNRGYVGATSHWERSGLAPGKSQNPLSFLIQTHARPL